MRTARPGLAPLVRTTRVRAARMTRGVVTSARAAASRSAALIRPGGQRAARVAQVVVAATRGPAALVGADGVRATGVTLAPVGAGRAAAAVVCAVATGGRLRGPGR